MDQAGIYPSPLLRPTFVECPVVAGYTTARLYSPYDFKGSSPVAGPLGDHMVAAVVENVGPNPATFVLNQTGTEWYTGTRTVLFSGTIQPGGRQATGFTITQPYLEVACTYGGPSSLRLQISSQMQWSVLGFLKTDPMYPQSLWKATYNAFPPVP